MYNFCSSSIITVILLSQFEKICDESSLITYVSSRHLILKQLHYCFIYLSIILFVILYLVVAWILSSFLPLRGSQKNSMVHFIAVIPWRPRNKTTCFRDNSSIGGNIKASLYWRPPRERYGKMPTLHSWNISFISLANQQNWQECPVRSRSDEIIAPL